MSQFIVFPIKTAALKNLTLKVVLLSSVRQCFLQIEGRLALTPQGGIQDLLRGRVVGILGL